MQSIPKDIILYCAEKTEIVLEPYKTKREMLIGQVYSKLILAH